MSRSIRFFIGLLLFAGCARVPEKDLARTLDAPSLQVSENTAFGKDFFERGEWPNEKWWEMFDDPQLNLLIERALQDNYTLKKAHAQVEYSHQLANKQRSKLFPELSGNYTEQWQYLSKYGFDRDFFPVPKNSPQEIPHTINLIDLTLNFDYEFDFWGKNRDLFRAALGQAWADLAEEKQAQLVAAVMVAQTYFSLQTKLSQRDILRERLEERKELLALTEMRNTIGLINALPVFASDKEMHLVKQAIVFLEEGLDLDKHMLKYLVGMGPDEKLLETVPQARFDKPFPLPKNISSDLLARRPDLMAQICRVESAAKQIGAAQADFYPSVNLSAMGGLESLQFSNLFRDSKTGGLMPAIHLPIFTGGRLRANLRSKVAAFNEAVYAYNDLVLTAAKEVADQIVTVGSVIEGLEEQKYAFEDTFAQYELLFSRYAKGLDNYLTVLDSEEDVLQQRFLLVGQYMDHLNSILNLIKRLGGGYMSVQIP
jgi:NodT family efflux transporter outer membrane factor (OMF) lipoprotein